LNWFFITGLPRQVRCWRLKEKSILASIDEFILVLRCFLLFYEGSEPG
jgi:hypothetical protein